MFVGTRGIDRSELERAGRGDVVPGGNWRVVRRSDGTSLGRHTHGSGERLAAIRANPSGSRVLTIGADTRVWKLSGDGSEAKEVGVLDALLVGWTVRDAAFSTRDDHICAVVTRAVTDGGLHVRSDVRLVQIDLAQWRVANETDVSQEKLVDVRCAWGGGRVAVAGRPQSSTTADPAGITIYAVEMPRMEFGLRGQTPVALSKDGRLLAVCDQKNRMVKVTSLPASPSAPSPDGSPD